MSVKMIVGTLVAILGVLFFGVQALDEKRRKTRKLEARAYDVLFKWKASQNDEGLKDEALKAMREYFESKGLKGNKLETAVLQEVV